MAERASELKLIEALMFDDVLLQPGASSGLQIDVVITTQLTPSIAQNERDNYSRDPQLHGPFIKL